MLLNQDLLGPSESTLPQSCCPGVFWVAIVLFWCETIEISWKKTCSLQMNSVQDLYWPPLLNEGSISEGHSILEFLNSRSIQDVKGKCLHFSIFCDYTAGVFLNQVSSDPNLGCLVYIWVYPTSLPAPKTTRNTPTTATSEATKNDRRHLLQSLSQHFTSSSSEFTTRQVQMLQRFPWRSTQKQRFKREKGESSWRN